MREQNQNDKYEKLIAGLFDLQRGESRIGEDAFDENRNPYELKSSTKSGGVSTARDLGPSYIKKHRGRYWIVARFCDDSIVGLWFLAPCHMAEWFDDLTRYFDKMTELANRTCSLASPFLLPEEVETIFLLMQDGMKLNDPCIPWRYINDHAIKIEAGADLPNILRDLVRQYPIEHESGVLPAWLTMV